MRTELLHILLVDDEPGQRAILEEIIRDEGHDVEVAESGEQALLLLEQGSWDLMVTDLRMPGMDGVALMRAARKLHPGLTVILMTAYATISSAVEAMKDGAYDYLQKPFAKEDLIQRVRHVAERAALVRENDRLRRELGRHAAPPILGESRAVMTLLRQVEKIAAAPGDVLISGASGTGKELVARRLHDTGQLAAGPFVPINCAAIPEGIAESELFGHEKGAFTHATSARAGRFEQADGGCLFLDEVGSMPLPLQGKLLRVLQDRVIERVGGGQPRRLEVRVIAASNRDLRLLVERGEFREDLYHRLNVLEIHIPPLSERRDDIPLLAAAFRDRAAARYAVPPPPIDDELLSFLRCYPYPGNVRELEHMMEKMVVLSDGEPLGLADLPPSIATAVPASLVAAGRGEDAVGTMPAAAESIGDHGVRPEELLAGGSTSLAEVEERLLAEALRQAGDNLSQAARRLGISYKTMRYRARKFGLIEG